MATKRLVTAEQLLRMGDIGRCELVRGDIIDMALTEAHHGDVSAQILVRVAQHVKAHNLGKVYLADTGFVIARDPDTVRAPDVGFVARRRLPPGPVHSYFPGAPDLAVEVTSLSDRPREIAEKIDEWLAAGTVSVWQVYPAKRTVEAHRRGAKPVTYGPGMKLADEPTLPGFVLDIDELFDAAS